MATENKKSDCMTFARLTSDLHEKNYCFGPMPFKRVVISEIKSEGTFAAFATRMTFEVLKPGIAAALKSLTNSRS